MRASLQCSVCGDCTWNDRAQGLPCSQRSCSGTYLRPAGQPAPEREPKRSIDRTRESLPYLDSTDLFHQGHDLGGEAG